MGCWHSCFPFTMKEQAECLECFFVCVCARVQSSLRRGSRVRHTTAHQGRAGAALCPAKGRGRQHEGQPCYRRTDARGWRAAGAEIQPGGPALTSCYRCCLVLLSHGRWERKGRNRGEREGRDSAEDTRTRSVGR